MCDIQKYTDMCDAILELKPEDTLELAMAAKSEEERNFFEMIGDFILQRRQNVVIAENRF